MSRNKKKSKKTNGIISNVKFIYYCIKITHPTKSKDLPALSALQLIYYLFIHIVISNHEQARVNIEIHVNHQLCEFWRSKSYEPSRVNCQRSNLQFTSKSNLCAFLVFAIGVFTFLHRSIWSEWINMGKKLTTTTWINRLLTSDVLVCSIVNISARAPSIVIGWNFFNLSVSKNPDKTVICSQFSLLVPSKP